jgi:hypothetical protein
MNGTASSVLALTLALAFFVSACDRHDGSKPSAERTFQVPTATEAFHLRSECALLGQKIMEENFIGSALRQPQVSHYTPMTNRCFVQLTVSTVTKPRDNYDIFLYDAQTRDMLASVSVKSGEKFGIIFGQAPLGSTADAGFVEVSEFINKTMENDRKQ